MSQELDSVMRQLEALGTAHTKKSYLSRGVKEPLFGVATGAMKPLKKQIGVNQPLAEELWDTGNFDAMYLAGMVADVRVMTEADFDRWMDGAYCAMLADSVVSVTLAESELAQSVANRWIHSGREDRAAAGWTTYEWLLGWRQDDYFEPRDIQVLLSLAAATIRDAAPRVRRAMNNFIVAVGVSYQPLHEQALHTADALGPVPSDAAGEAKPLPGAGDQIRKAAEKGRIGFKRRAVRC